jgi:hypothetical protein
MDHDYLAASFKKWGEHYAGTERHFMRGRLESDHADFVSKCYGKVADICCGEMAYKADFSKKSFVGVDFSFAALKRAKERHGNGDFVCASATHLPFRDGCFDVVMSATGLQAAGKNGYEFLREMCRASGGRIRSDVSYPDCLEFVYGGLMSQKVEFVDGVGYTEDGNGERVNHGRFFSEEEVASILSDNGMRGVAIERYSLRDFMSEDEVGMEHRDAERKLCAASAGMPQEKIESARKELHGKIRGDLSTKLSFVVEAEKAGTS